MQETHQEHTQEKNGQDSMQDTIGQNLVEQTKTEQAESLKQDSMPQEMPLYTSPILLLLEIAPNPMPICVQCPKAMWHIAKNPQNPQETTIRCFCQAMHSITYQAPQEKNPKSEIMIEHCDGQLAALQELGESE